MGNPTIDQDATIAQLRSVMEKQKDALQSIQQYGLDTLSGRIDGPDDRDWQRSAVLEMTKRAQHALNT